MTPPYGEGQVVLQQYRTTLAAAKSEAGLDHHAVRHDHGCYRPMTLAFLALADLAVVRS